jgi:hypothetical protein
METTVAPTPAGWSPDPAGGSGWRYWDGQQRTDHRAGGRWWTAYLVAGFSIQPVSLVAGLRDDHTAATAAAVGALAFVLWLWAFFSARTFVEEGTASLRAGV